MTSQPPAAASADKATGHAGIIPPPPASAGPARSRPTPAWPDPSGLASTEAGTSARRTYLEQVRAHLGRLPQADTAAILADLTEALLDHASGDLASIEATFGSARDYAQTARTAFTDPSPGPGEPRPAQARLLGVPVDLRGPTDAAVRARMWDPGNPAIFVPRLVGIGWRVNLGAVAVRLGLLRPDDCDEDVLEQIPAGTRRVARSVPLALSVTTVALLIRRWRQLPDTVPTSWDITGRPSAAQPKGVLLGIVALGLGPALWAQLPTDQVEDELTRNALATWCAAAAAATIGASLADAQRPDGARGHGQLVPIGLLAAGALAFLEMYLPIRAGLRTAWQSPSNGTLP